MINKKTCSAVAVAALVATYFSNDIRTSFDGLLITGNAEGCIAEPYKCQADKTTIGIGSTSGVIENRIYSNEEIAKRWASDIKIAEICVNDYFNGSLMGQSQFEAMTDLIFNVGCYGVRWNSKKNQPTSIYQYAQAQDWKNMCQHIPDFINVNSKPNQGLINRRNTDLQHCLKGL